MLEVNKIYCGDNLGELSKFPDCFFDSCVTDPPYFLLSGSGSGGFMNKEWDGISNFKERILWKSKEFAQYVIRFFSLMKVELNMGEAGFVQENANMNSEGSNNLKKSVSVLSAENSSAETSPKSNQNFNSVQGFVLTEEEMLGLLKEVFQDLITVPENQSGNVLYAIPLSFIEIKNKNVVLQDVAKFLMEKAQGGQTIMLSLMEEARISGAIEGMIGIKLDNKSTKEMVGCANVAGNIVIENKYNVITLNNTERLKIMHWITSLLFAIFVIQELKVNQNNSLIYLFHKNWLREVYRVLKPGGYILAFAGCRTYHLLASSIEDVGFEIRDQIDWNFGSGFPKSLDISKAIDKQAGAERTNVIGKSKYEGRRPNNWGGDKNGDMTYGDYNAQPEMPIYEAATDEAKQWEGWGTALKPAHEPICMARKPLSENTIAENVLKHGTGGINIDGCRIGDAEIKTQGGEKFKGDGIFGKYEDCEESFHKGRFPANLILDEFMGNELDKQSGTSISTASDKRNGTNSKGNGGFVLADREEDLLRGHNDEGGASRFFYCAKADNYERNKGLKGFEGKFMDEGREIGSAGGTNPRNRGAEKARNNHHPTVKPIDLMRYLVRLITPKNGIVLDPFNGSGTTGIAAKLELMKYVGIERDEEYCKISEARIAAWNPEKYKPQLLFDAPTEIKKPKPIELTQAELFG